MAVFLCVWCADVTGAETPDSGSERERRASLLLDLAAFVEEEEGG